MNLKKAKERNMVQERVKQLSKYKLLIIDEIGYLPLDKECGDLLFQLINGFYEKKSLIITTNKPFNEWADLFGCEIISSAILDRLLHHSIIVSITGKSYRIYESCKENGIVFDDKESK